MSERPQLTWVISSDGLPGAVRVQVRHRTADDQLVSFTNALLPKDLDNPRLAALRLEEMEARILQEIERLAA